MTQQEVARAMQKELKKSISQSYLSQIESGARPHLTNDDAAAAGASFSKSIPDTWWTIPRGSTRS